MTNKQLQNILKQYPDDIEINVEKCGIYENGKIVSLRVDYEEENNIEKPQLTIEYEKEEY